MRYIKRASVNIKLYWSLSGENAIFITYTLYWMLNNKAHSFLIFNLLDLSRNDYAGNAISYEQLKNMYSS